MRVGTSRKPDCIYNPYEDHPHACGDKYCINLDTASPQGSSPCVWGQAQYCFAVAHGHRIIPMRVGTRTLTCTDLQLMRDHPHACGDKSLRIFPAKLRRGSSPCVWGQVTSVKLPCGVSRIIPMRVGTSTYPFCYLKVHKDHPHACGDKVSGSPESCTAAGSSPCVWGQAARNTFAFKPFRIIPMRVGTSAVLPARRGLIRDHPHACGDKRRTALRLWH